MDGVLWNISRMRGPTWLNTVLAIPVIGLVTQPRLDFPVLVWSLLGRMQQKWLDDGLGTPQVQAVSATDVRVDFGKGRYMTLSPSGVVAGYSFNVNLKTVPGGLPELEFLEFPSYAKLQEAALSSIEDFLEVGFDPTSRYSVVRIGVMALTRLEATSGAPPGVTNYLSALERAAGSKLLAVEGNILSLVGKRDGWLDQCHHVCKLNTLDDAEGLRDLDFNLDYQRVWDPMKAMGFQNLRDELHSVASAANAYFEAFGAGDRA